MPETKILWGLWNHCKPMSSGDSTVSTDLEINMGSSIVNFAEDPVKGNVSFDFFLKTTLL